MQLRAFVFAVLGLWATLGLAGCGGGESTTPAGTAAGLSAAGSATTTAQSPYRDASTQTVGVQGRATTANFVLDDGSRGSLTLHSTTSNASLNIHTGASAAFRSAESLRICPAPEPIVITNPFAFPITVTIDAFTLVLPCSVNGLLFGASAYQSNPVPPSLVSTKLGNATGSGNAIAFKPTVSQLTFPAKTTLTIAILAETSTAFTQLPAVPTAAVTLTSNAPQVPNSLALTASGVSGGTTFQSACYLPGDPAGPGLSGQPILGTPSFYCVLLPGQAGTSTAFGSNGKNGTVTFTLGPNAKPDASYVSLDGPAIFAPCAPAGSGQTCIVGPFSLPTYSKAIVGNVGGIAVCVPATENTDCNGAAGNPPAPAAPAVPAHGGFQLLFADDPTYDSANGFGGVTLSIAAASLPYCAIQTAADDENDAPPGYFDAPTPSNATPSQANFAGVGPDVEFDVVARKPTAFAPNTTLCTITLTENSGLKRSFTYSIAVQQPGKEQ